MAHSSPTATLAIFHGRHYSRVEVHAEQPRPLLGNPADASADQLRAVWGPFVAEAGTFEVSGSDVITMRATVAKNPAAMRDGASSVYSYRRQGDTLTLTEVRTPAGPSALAVTVTLTARRVMSAHINGDPAMTVITPRVLARRPRASRRRDLSWRDADSPQ